MTFIDEPTISHLNGCAELVWSSAFDSFGCSIWISCCACHLRFLRVFASSLLSFSRVKHARQHIGKRTNLTNNVIVLQSDINEIIFVWVCVRAIVYHRPLILLLTIDIMPCLTQNLSAVKHFWMFSGDFCADKPTWTIQKDVLLTIITVKPWYCKICWRNCIKLNKIQCIFPSCLISDYSICFFMALAIRIHGQMLWWVASERS